MLRQLDVCIQDRWRKDSMKDDNRSLAASKVIADWEARMKSFVYKEEGGKIHNGCTFEVLGNGFKQAKKNGDAQKVVLKKGIARQLHLYAYMPAKQFLAHFLS